MVANHFYERPSNYARVPAPVSILLENLHCGESEEERAFEILEAQRHDGVHGAQHKQRQ